MKNIVVINAHPSGFSFCHALASKYIEVAKAAGFNIESIVLRDMQYDFNLKHGYLKRMELEPDLLEAWNKISAADHLVVIYPTWWGTMPANLKGFFDRLFLPGMAFKYRENSVWWDKLLAGKTAHIITTMDTPAWYYKIIYSNAGIKVLKNNILSFCGIKTKKVTILSPLKNSTESARNNMISQVEKYASKGI